MSITITDSINGYLTNSDLLKSEATIRFETNRQTLNIGGIIFSVLDENFNFSLEVNNMQIYLKRNGNVCVFDANRFDFATHGDTFVIFCLWSPTKLQIYLREQTGKPDAYLLEESLDIDYFETPYRIIKEAFKQSLIPRQEYETVELFRQQCYEVLQKIQEKINQHPSKDIFWNVIKKGKKIIEKRPKDETDLHSAIYHMIFDAAITANIEVIPEYTTGVGNVDFVFLGQIKNHINAKMCIEFKRAHASDLEHGLKIQLPAYMKNINAEYAAFGVFSFKGDLFNEPKETLHELALKLGKWQDPISNKIRIFTYDLSHPKSASKI